MAAILVRFAVVARIQFQHVTYIVGAMVFPGAVEIVLAEIRDRFVNGFTEFHGSIDLSFLRSGTKASLVFQTLEMRFSSSLHSQTQLITHPITICIFS